MNETIDVLEVPIRYIFPLVLLIDSLKTLHSAALLLLD